MAQSQTQSVFGPSPTWSTASPYAQPKQANTSGIAGSPDYTGQAPSAPSPPSIDGNSTFGIPSTFDRQTQSQPNQADPYALYQQYSQANPTANINGLLDFYKQNGVNASLATHGVGAVNGVGGNLPSDDKLIVNGQIVDFIGNAGPGGSNTWQYNPDTGVSGGGPMGAMGSAMAGGAGGSISPFNVLDPRAGDLYNTLLSRANQSLKLDPKDPIIAAQTDAYGAQQTRGVRDYLDQQAEAQGPNANLSAESRLANEHAAQATGSMQASLMQNELMARRGEIQNALSQMGSLLSDQQKINLQQQLGMIDANLRQQGINSGNDQFAARLGLDTTNSANQWNWLYSGGGLS